MDSSTIKVGIGGAAVVGVAFGMARYAYGLTLPAVRSEFGLPEPVLGAIASGTFLGYLLGLLAAPRLSGRRGPRAPTTVGGLCGVAGCATVAVAPSPWVLAAGAVLAGSAAGWVWAPYSDVVAEVVPPRHRPTVLAVITTGTSAGLVAVAGAGVLAASTSWRLTWAIIALAASVAAVVNVRTVPRLQPRDEHCSTIGAEASHGRAARVRRLLLRRHDHLLHLRQRRGPQRRTGCIGGGLGVRRHRPRRARCPGRRPHGQGSARRRWAGEASSW